MPANQRGNNGNHRPPTARGLHDLGVLDLAEAAHESQAALRALADAMRRANDAHAYLARAYQRITHGWARDHGDDDEPTPLAEVVPFTRDHLAAA